MKSFKKTFSHGITTAIASLAVAGTSPALACGSDPYIGSICITAATFCPADEYVEANGQLLSIAEYQSLFSLLGDIYGGNGTSTFGVPDMRGRTPVGVGTGTGLTPVVRGQKRGIDVMTLTLQQLPKHSHTASFTPDGGSSTSIHASTKLATKPQAATGDYIASNNPLGGAPKFIAAGDAEPTVALGGVSGGGAGGTVQVGTAGNSQAFANYPPQQALKYCIAVSGLYPRRP